MVFKNNFVKRKGHDCETRKTNRFIRRHRRCRVIAFMRLANHTGNTSAQQHVDNLSEILDCR